MLFPNKQRKRVTREFLNQVRNSLSSKITNITLVEVEEIINCRLLFHFENAWTTHGGVPEIVFHGTRASNLPNIKKYGLRVPGWKSGIFVSNGSAYGCGIYLASNPGTSLSYVREAPRLLVCLALTKANSGISGHGNIFVARDESLVLPCFIVHFSGRSYFPEYRFITLARQFIWNFRRFCFRLFLSAVILFISSSILLWIIDPGVFGHATLELVNSFSISLFYWTCYIIYHIFFGIFWICWTIASSIILQFTYFIQFIVESIFEFIASLFVSQDPSLGQCLNQSPLQLNLLEFTPYEYLSLNQTF